MPIVFVCDARLDIVWIDGNFCEVIDCDRHEALGRGLYEFLAVPEGHPLRHEVTRLTTDLRRASYTTELRGADQRSRVFDFYLEHVPTFDGVEGASVIAVGVQFSDRYPAESADEQDDDDRLATDDLRRAYRYSNLREEDGRALFARLDELVTSTEAYRRQGFTLEEAAAALNSNVLYVSQVTNYFSGYSFPNYLNQKRYEKLEEIIRSDGDMSFVEKFTAAGFGSYSALNRFLKNHHHTSPAQLLQRAKEEEGRGG